MNETNIKEAEIVEEKVEETKEAKTAPLRQIIIETDGDKINLIKAEVSGRIELLGILQTLVSYINNPPKDK
jgi:hypothetical protein